MKIISLKDFILTGYFGGVEFEMSASSVIEYLGHPTSEGDLASGFKGVRYNNLEFFFFSESNKLMAIQDDYLNDFFDQRFYPLNNQTCIDVSYLRDAGHCTYSNLKSFFDKEGAEYIELEKDGYDEFKFVSGVTLDFENWYEAGKLRENALLSGIRYFNFG